MNQDVNVWKLNRMCYVFVRVNVNLCTVTVIELVVLSYKLGITIGIVVSRSSILWL